MRPTESELWETLDLPASQAGGGNTWMPRRIERGALDASCTRADVISLRSCLLSFFGVFLFWRPQSGARPALHGDGIRYGAHRSTGFAARFQPIDRGNRELGGHGRAQTLAGDWAVQARSPAGSGSLVGRVLWRPARRIACECCRLCTCRGWYGVQWAATSNKQFPTAGRSGSGRQPPVL